MDNIINELSKRYNELHKDFQSVQNLVNDIDFVFDYTEEEQCLFYRMRSTMEEYYGALLRLIRYLKKQELEEQGIKDWSQFKKTDSTYIGVDVSNEGDHGACCQACGDDIATHHCGQDCDCDDACCQAGSPCGRSAVTYDPNESQPVDTKPAITGESLYKLLGRQVICFLKPGESRCENCQFNPDDPEDCVKVELVGGCFLCLANTQPNEGAF